MGPARRRGAWVWLDNAGHDDEDGHRVDSHDDDGLFDRIVSLCCCGGNYL